MNLLLELLEKTTPTAGIDNLVIIIYIHQQPSLIVVVVNRYDIDIYTKYIYKILNKTGGAMIKPTSMVI